MARCTQKDCDWYGKKGGVRMHLFRAHGIRTKHDVVSEPNTLASESKVCPVIGCGLKVDDVLVHARLFHPEWLMSNGKFVFEVR